MKRLLAFLLAIPAMVFGGGAGCPAGKEGGRPAPAERKPGDPPAPEPPAPSATARPSAATGTAVVKTEAEWRATLTPAQYHVCREKGTERAFTGEYWDHHEKGVYRCVACGNGLFASGTKFDSGTGWPSYYQPVAPGNVKTEVDRALFMERIEVMCARCEAHLGHVFDDGPAPTGLRYCINSVSLKFDASGDARPEPPK